jgi:hypothetical protein
MLCVITLTTLLNGVVYIHHVESFPVENVLECSDEATYLYHSYKEAGAGSGAYSYLTAPEGTEIVYLPVEGE